MKTERIPVLATSTTATAEQARDLAHRLVEAKLAACVQIVDPIISVYRWQEKVEEEREVLLLIKSTRELVPRIEELFAEIHSYEVPELIAVSIDSGSKAYLDWLLENTAPPAASPDSAG